MSFNDIDDTLVAYFKQMLEEECEQQNPEDVAPGLDDAIVQKEVQAQSENEQVNEPDVEVAESQADEPVAEQELESDDMAAAEAADETVESEASQSDETPAEDSEESAAEEIAASEEEIPAEEDAVEAVETEEVEAQTVDTEAQSDDAVPETEDISMDSEVSSEGEIDAEASAEADVQTEEPADTEVKAESSAEDIDYASDDYVPEDTSAQTKVHELQPQLQTVEEKNEPLPFAEHKSLESLLESVPKTQLETEVAIETPVETAVETETEVKTETAVETVVEEQTAVEEATTSEAVAADENIAQAEQEEANDEAPYNWTNIEMPDEFQVLFFLVKGIRFAVPLVNLGGIFQCEKVTPLFGKPDWFQGIADIRGRKMNVVDTLKWVKSDAPQSDKYEYMISLDKTLWSIGCDVLEGNRILSKENITWRQTAGNRPWLAGIVKKEMCALLHVKALIKMFENGVNLKDLDAQMSA